MKQNLESDPLYCRKMSFFHNGSPCYDWIRCMIWAPFSEKSTTSHTSSTPGISEKNTNTKIERKFNNSTEDNINGRERCSYLSKYTFLILFKPSVAFHIETSRFICTANYMTDPYMECNIKLKWVIYKFYWKLFYL